MEYFWQSEIAYGQDKRADGSFIRRKAFISGQVVEYDLMDANLQRGHKYYSRWPDLQYLGAGEIYEIRGVKQGRFRNMNVNEKYCVTIEDVYGVPFAALSAPQGYEFTGEFRPPLSGDTILSGGRQLPAKIGPCDVGKYPRLILRALPTVESVYDGQTLEQLKEGAKTATWAGDSSLKFEWTGEFRKVQQGEYFLRAPSGWGVNLDDSGIFTGAYRLIMRKCPTIKEIYDKELSELTPPKGYEFGEFRRLQEGDDWLNTFDLKVSTNCPDFGNTQGNFRLILKKKATTVEEIYGAPLNQLTPPIGYRFTGEFRNAKAGETAMLTGGLGAFTYGSDEYGPHHPRLILEKLPPTPTIKDVYGTDTPAIPKGWRFKEFRRISEGEKIAWLTAYGRVLDMVFDRYNSKFENDFWRIVLEKEVDLREFKWPMGPKHVYGEPLPTVPAGYEVVAFRPPVEGEKFIPSTKFGGVDTARVTFYSPRFILSPLGPR